RLQVENGEVGMFRSMIICLCCVLGACKAGVTPDPAASAIEQPATSGAGAAAVAQGVAAEDGPIDASFVLPGPYAQATTLADLQTRFGAVNVKIIEPATSGEPRSVVLFPDDPSRRAYLQFHDDQALTALAHISVRDAGSRWRGKHGVRVGMTLAELQRLNGKLFYFSGFDELHRGWVRDQWSPSVDGDEGRPGKFDVADEDHMYFGVDLGPRATAEAIPASAYPHDENSVSSDDPRYPRLGELFVVTAFSGYTSLDDEWE
ncbi:MAG: hypothetical protein ABIO30_04660, partial [Thermomonas sp.]